MGSHDATLANHANQRRHFQADLSISARFPPKEVMGCLTTSPIPVMDGTAVSPPSNCEPQALAQNPASRDEIRHNASVMLRDQGAFMAQIQAEVEADKTLAPFREREAGQRRGRILPRSALPGARLHVQAQVRTSHFRDSASEDEAE